MKPLILTITILAWTVTFVLGQNKQSVVIGTMISRPNAVLIINPPNKNQGFLLPQLTTGERLSIAPVSPQDNGLMVYDLTENSFYYWSGNTWVKGLGDSANQIISYDAATQRLTLNGNGGEVDLTTLKEIPSTTGNAGRYLTTDGTTLSWANVGALGDITAIITGQGLSAGASSGDVNLSVNTDGTTISVNGSNQLQLSDAAVTTPKISSNAVNSAHIMDGSVTSTDILDNTISTNDLANSSVTSVTIAPNAVNTTHINSGGNSKVLTTDASGLVQWSDRSTFTDDNQNLSFSGNTVSIDNGTGVNLSANGQVTGLLDNLIIQPGTSNQVLVTNAAGTSAGWVTSAGDVTGPPGTSTVARIQGRDISNAAPSTGDALIWNGTAWVPTTVTPSPVVSFLAVDPSSFQGLEPGGNNTSILGLFEDNNSTFVFAKGPARQIMAPVNLPHGATVQSVTVYYEYSLLLGPIEINFYRKNFSGGANETLGTIFTPLIGLGVQAASVAGATVVDNSTYSYRIHVTFTNLLNVTDPALALQRIHGVRIQYSK